MNNLKFIEYFKHAFIQVNYDQNFDEWDIFTTHIRNHPQLILELNIMLRLPCESKSLAMSKSNQNLLAALEIIEGYGSFSSIQLPKVMREYIDDNMIVEPSKNTNSKTYTFPSEEKLNILGKWVMFILRKHPEIDCCKMLGIT